MDRRRRCSAAIRDSVAYAREHFRRRRILRRGRDPHRARLPGRGAVGRGRRAGATTLNVPDTVGYTTPDEIYDLFRFLIGAVDRPDGRDLLGPLPRRSRNGGRQLAGGRPRRRAAGRMRDERHRRTRGKLRARGRRHGAADSLRLLWRHHQRRHDQDHAREPDAGPDHQRAAAAQQVDRRRQRLRPRSGHPPAWRAAEPARRTRSSIRRISASRRTGSCSASIAAATRSPRAPRRSATYSKASNSTARSPPSRRSPTRSASSIPPGWSHAALGSADHRQQELWKLSKVDIRAPVSANAWPVARVELEHGERGRVTRHRQRSGRAGRRLCRGQPDDGRAGARRQHRHAVYRRRSRTSRRRTDRARACWWR